MWVVSSSASQKRSAAWQPNKQLLLALSRAKRVTVIDSRCIEIAAGYKYMFQFYVSCSA
jgi:hypothetical protein